MDQSVVVAPSDPIAVWAFVGYLLLAVGIGVYATRFSSAGVREFFVGGRQMHPFVVALSAVVSGRSSWLLLGVTGTAYLRGASAVWTVAGFIFVELLLFLFYAPRLRRFSEQYDCVTLPDFFAARFGDRRGVLRGTLAVVILLFMTLYVSSQFVGGGKAIASSFGLDRTTGVVMTAAIVLVYTALGGFLAVSLTDMMQACFMIVALVVLPFIAINSMGGLGPVLEQLQALDPATVDPFSIAVGIGIGWIAIGLGSPGNPHILVRYMSIRDATQLRYAAVVGTIWNVVMGWGAVFIGLAGRVYFPDASVFPGGDTEFLYPMLAQDHLPALFFGAVVASIFASIMSTADSQLLVAASSIVRDLYERVLRRGRELSQSHLVFLSRAVIVLLVGLALLLGFRAERLVFDLVLFAWGGLGAAIGPTSILALYWKRTTAAGVFAGLVAGGGVTILWETSATLSPLLYELIPGFTAGLAATVGVSLLTAPPGDVTQQFDAMAPPGA